MLALSLCADLTGVTQLLPLDTQDEPYFYTFKVQCTSCREVHPNWVSISRHESNDISGSRGEANFVWRCKSCKVFAQWECFLSTKSDGKQRETSATIKGPPNPYIQASPPVSHNIIEIDCRGLEFTDFKADGEWTAKGLETPTKFTGIDLQEGEWFDYDEKASDEVSIKDIKWSIRRA